MRLVSYLSPGLPHSLFRAIAGLVEPVAGPVEISFVSDRSGPAVGDPDPWGEADLAYMCEPAYLELRARGLAQLVPAGMVFDDARNGGRPVYFSDVVVVQDHPARSIADLSAATWAVNDDRSLSGYWCVFRAFPDGVETVTSGSHAASAGMVRDGTADTAAIDSNVMGSVGAGLRIVDSFGPHPIQPLVARPGLAGSLLADIARSLLDADPPPPLTGFAPVSAADYPN